MASKRSNTTTRTGSSRGAHTRSAGKARKAAPEGLSPRSREILSLVLLGLTAFLALAFVSSGRGDNLCGAKGEVLASWLLGSFGHAAWLIVGCFGIWGGVLFTRAEAPSFSIRGAGLLLCLVSCSALLAHLFGDISGRYPAGGVLGEYINSQLMEVAGLGVVGTRIVLVVATLITFVLATDIAYYAALVAGARWVAETGAVVQAAANEAAARRRKAKRGARRVRGQVVEPEADGWEAGAGEAGDSDDAEEEVDEADEDDEAEEELDEDETAAAALLAADDDEAEADEEQDDEQDEADADETAEDETESEGDDEGDETRLAADGDEDEQVAASADEDADEPEAAVPRGAGTGLGDAALAAAAGPPRVREMGTGTSAHELNPQGELVDVAKAVACEYVFPPIHLLEDQEVVDQGALDELLAEKTRILETTLQSFRIEARVVEIQKGPVISMFEMELAPGIKVEKLRSLEDDLAIALRARSVRIVAPIPGKNTIGIEVPNPLREVVRLKSLLGTKEYSDHKFALPIFLGRDAAGNPMVVDLAKMPHLLVAGATGSGKSVCLNTIICSFLFTRTPEQVKLVLIDPKMVEMSQFSNAPHLACPVVNDMKRAPGILDWAVTKMEERYRLLHRAGVRNIYSYNKMGDARLREVFGEAVDEPDFPRFLPFIVIIVDELADLMMTAAKDVETSITRIAAKSRAVGIHIILATQRPSTNVITGLIKANLPTRIAFMVSSKIDSRVILDVNGAEQLLGQGDMLFMPPHTSNIVRGQCTYMSEEEVRAVMEFVKVESGPSYERELVQSRNENGQDPTELDDLYDPAVRFMIETQRGSASLLQRKFAIGYTRASRLIDLMADEGVLGEYKGSQAREVTMTLEEWIARNPEARGAAAEAESV